MERKIINHHKWKRRLKRQKKETLFSAFSRSQGRRDYSWTGKPKANPYRQATTQTISIKRILEMSLLATSIIGSAAVLTLHPVFAIGTIHLTGLRQISEEALRQDIDQLLSQKMWGILPKRSYVLFDTEQLTAHLSAEYPIEEIHFEKKFPDSVTIRVKEKISTVLYTDGVMHTFLGLDGLPVKTPISTTTSMTTATDALAPIETIEDNTATSTTPTSTPELVNTRYIAPLQTLYGTYPIVYDLRSDKEYVQSEIIAPHHIAGIIAWYEYLTKQTTIPLAYITISSNMGEGTIMTQEGWYIRVKFQPETIETQKISLEEMLRDPVINKSQLRYIDVRFGNKVFWK